MKRVLRCVCTLALAFALVGCSGASETPATQQTVTTPPSQTPAAPPPLQPPPVQPALASSLSITPLFCAFGGVGLVPDPLPPGYETVFASVVVQVDNPGAPIGPITLGSASLDDESGAPLASLLRLDHFVVLPEVEPEGPTMGSFAVHLNPEGTPFDGTLPSGRTILRAHFSLDHSPSSYPARCRIELAGTPTPLVSNGELAGEWPTS